MKTWQLVVASLVVSVLLAGGGYWLGTMHGPERVEVQTKEVVKRVEVADTKAEAKVRELTARLETLQRQTHVVRTTVSHPDGTRVTSVVRDVQVNKTEESKQSLSAALHSEGHTQTQTNSTVQASRVEVSRPDWRVGALVGLEVNGILSGPLQPVYGAHVERRIAGPFSVGIWGLSSGVGGVSLSGEFW